MARYLDPKNDLAFKKIFGARRYKSVPIDFLNAALHLKGEEQIVDLNFLDTRQPPDIEAQKESVLDVLVEDQRGDKFIVEMQVAKVEGFEKRAQYYAARAFCADLRPGGKYAGLKKVIFLAITNFNLFPDKGYYKSNHKFLDTETHENDLQGFSFTFVELPKFTKTLDQLETVEDRWYYFLKHADENEHVRAVLATHPEIKKAYRALERYHWKDGELRWYEKLVMDQIDAEAKIDAAINDGLEKGMKKGIEKGMKKGIEKGIEKGVEKERKESAKRLEETAKNLFEMGLSIDQIVRATKLSSERVVELQKPKPLSEITLPLDKQRRENPMEETTN